MQEITIPDGHKATILGGTIRIEPIEKEFKRGDILIHEDSLFIIIFDHTDYQTKGERHIAFCSEKLETVGYPPYYNGQLYDSGCGYTKEYRLATPEEQQILFDALAKEGKYWDAEALEVKDLIKVPESIGIYRCKEDFGTDGDGLYIAFNDNKQLLYSNSKYGTYSVSPLHNGYNKVQCYLKPCKREDLEVGDTAFISKSDYFDNLYMYYKMIDISEYGFARAFGNDIKMVGVKTDLDIRFYKLIPINK